MDNILGYVICETASSEPAKPEILDVQNGRVHIEACIQDMEVRNRNGRFYAKDQLGPELTSPRTVELLESGNLFGEAGHPMSTELSRQQTIDPRNMSHLFHKLWIDKNNVMAHISAANTAVGDDFHRLIIAGTMVSFSLRALGTIRNTARGAEVMNPKVVTWDWVVYPSHKTAYMTKTINVNESVILGESNHFLLEANDAGLLIPVNNDKVIKFIKESSSNLNTVLESFEFMYESTIVNPNGSVTLRDKNGAVVVVTMENHIRREIQDYCSKRR